jgi:hypothetical protein
VALLWSLETSHQALIGHARKIYLNPHPHLPELHPRSLHICDHELRQPVGHRSDFSVVGSTKSISGESITYTFAGLLSYVSWKLHGMHRTDEQLFQIQTLVAGLVGLIVQLYVVLVNVYLVLNIASASSPGEFGDVCDHREPYTNENSPFRSQQSQLPVRSGDRKY